MANVAATATAAEVLEIDGPIIWMSKDLDDSDQIISWKINGKKMPMNTQVIVTTGDKREFCLNGELHRLDGPAVTVEGEESRYFIHGRECADEHSYRYAVELIEAFTDPMAEALHATYATN